MWRLFLALIATLQPSGDQPLSPPGAVVTGPRSDLERRDLPVTPDDLRLLDAADRLLPDEGVWNRHDTRDCPTKPRARSLFCALQEGCIQVLGAYEHRRAAIQEVRFAIEDATNRRPFEHRLRDYNNLPTTSFADIKKVLRVARERVAARLPSAQASPPTSAAAGVTAFVGVSVVPGDRPAVLADQTVVVDAGRITALGPSRQVKVPRGATTVNARGKYLMAGLAEMHGHLPDQHLLEESVEQTLKLFVINGVTTVRGMQGAPNQIALRRRVEGGELLGPRLFCYSEALGGENAATAEIGARRVRAAKQAGFDGIKVHEGLRPAVYEAIARTAKEVGLPFGGHVPNEVGLLRALAAGQKSIEHLDGYVEALAGDYAEPPRKGERAEMDLFRGVSLAAMARVDEGRIPALVEATRRAGAMVTPTMMVWRILFRDAKVNELRRLPELVYWSAAEVDQWIEHQTESEKRTRTPAQLAQLMGVRRKLLKALADAGLVMMGSDTPFGFSVPGFSLRNEVPEMVKAGLTPAQIIASGTVAAARYLGVEKDSGTVAIGKRADLILLDGNPLDDVANLFRSAGVMVKGRWLPRAELDRMLGEIERANRWPAAADQKDLPVSATEGALLAGSYQLPAQGGGGLVTVRLDGHTIVVRDPHAKEHRLLLQGGRRFLVGDVKATVHFEPADGPATTLVLVHAGSRVQATRPPP